MIMPYVKFYDGPWDAILQTEMSEDEAKKHPYYHVMEVSDTPFEGVRVVPRNRSEWPEDITLPQYRGQP
jgi:hypothetical protein